MEMRKVQVTGGSSFIITLPKDWINEMGISKNDPLGVVQQVDGTLLIVPGHRIKTKSRKKDIVLDDIEDGAHLFRLMIGAYVTGYRTIELVSSKRVRPFIREKVRDFVQTAIGFEIVDETNRLIVLKDLLDPSQMPFASTIERMGIIVSDMHKDCMRSLTKGDRAGLESVIFRDKDVDRLQWLIARQYTLVLDDVTLAGSMGVSRRQANAFYLMARTLERIGDHAVRIAENCMHLLDGVIEDDLMESIKAVDKDVIEASNKISGLWRSRDIDGLNRTIDRIKGIERSLDEMDPVASIEGDRTSMRVGNVIGSIGRVADYTTDLCEIAINHIMLEE